MLTRTFTLFSPNIDYISYEYLITDFFLKTYKL